METQNNLKKNAEGYSDPTAFHAITNVEKQNKDSEYIKFHKLLDTIFDACDLAGYHLEERLVLRNKETGKIWR